tara:strand:+ start:336 stop:872 length:537 start_codon:yes stop_codon:yes gene_type:complete
MPVTINGTSGVVTATTFSGSSLSGIDTGKILQVIQTTKTDTQSIQSQSFIDITGMSATITPLSTSSKILVNFNVSLACNNYGMINLQRGSTDIFKGDTVGNRTSCTIAVSSLAVYQSQSYGTTYLDSPNTTSATTYKLQISTPYDSSYFIKINIPHTDADGSYIPRPTSQMTLMEVAA